MRTRRADLWRCRRNHRAVRHAVFLLQGSRRKQTVGFDPDSRRNHRLLLATISRGSDPKASGIRGYRKAARRTGSAATNRERGSGDATDRTGELARHRGGGGGGLAAPAAPKGA